MGTAGQSITLANSIIGVGILAMPYCFQQCGVLLATLILIFMGLISRLCCYFLLKSAIQTRRRTYELLAFHVFGPSGKLAVEVGIIGFLMGTCIAYFVVVGDLGPQIIAKLLNINQSDILRTSIMVIVSLVCILPLGLLRNVDSLSNVSAATIGFYICLVVKILSEASSRMFSVDGDMRVELWKPSGVLQCVPIFSMALFCQTQLFEIFESLPTLSLERMTRVTKNAIHICTGVYLTLGLFGYIAFSKQTITGNILMSLGSTMANDVIRLGFVMSLAFSFPLIIFPCRASLYSFLFKKAHSSHHEHVLQQSMPEPTFRALTLAIIAASLVVSLALPDISLVLGLVGATIGVLICVALPAATVLALPHSTATERLLAKFTLVLGLCIMVLGTYANLEAAEYKLDRYDAKTLEQERIDKLVEDFFDKMEKTDGTSFEKTKEEKSKMDTNNIVKVVEDSAVQPPNPVPPESQSNEVKSEPDVKAVSNKDQIDALPIEEAQKASETHPKNIKSKLKEGNQVDENIRIESKVEKPSVKELEVNKIEQKPKDSVPQEKTPENELMKQQKLIETIKQHGEEQKELIKEQKEILQELQKTKDELQQNKKEMDSNDAKKIAVESIQKIADVAIKSLVGVTDKPLLNEVVRKDSEPIEKIANDAVKEIAKKAVETIEAIKEIKERPKDLGSIQGIGKNENANLVQSQIQVENNGAVNVHPPAQNQPAVQNPSPAQNLINQPNQVPLNKNGLQANDFSQPIVTKLAELNSKQAKNNNLPNGAKPTQNDYKKEIVSGIVQPAVNVNSEQKQNTQQKAHLHAADEPESYKQGEDIKLKLIQNNDIKNKVPIPLALNSKEKKEEVAKIPQVEPPNSVQNSINIANNAAEHTLDNIAPNVDTQIRQKREVVDCTNKQVLRPEDKKICEALIETPAARNKDNSEQILQNVDLNDHLQKRLPIDAFHARSLKNFNEARKR